MRSLIAALILIVGISAGIILSNVEVVSILKGSHYVEDISGAGNDVNCSVCHKSVAEEMEITRALHGPHWDLSCEACHRFNGTGIHFAKANASGAFPGREAHAAYIPSCLDCHGGNGVNVTNVTGSRVHAPPARAFNIITTLNHRNITIISSIPYAEAHKQFIAYCENSLHDENLACLACHTNYSIDISYTYQYNLTYSIKYWTFQTFTPIWGKTYNVNYAKKSYFSGKHIFLPLENINCSRCHYNIYRGLINGTHAPIYRYVGGGQTWPSYNLWGFYRYHALGYYSAGTYVLTGNINSSYCKQCHYSIKINLTSYTTGAKFTSVNPFTAAAKGLVHCAEKISCYTCHHRNSTYWWLDPYYAVGNINSTKGGNATGHEYLINQTITYARMYHGDVCMACHEPSVHGVVKCNDCHYYGGHWWKGTIYPLYFRIESEPNGSATVWY